MKNIKLEVHYSEIKKKYYLPLEHGERIYFKTKREGNSFKSIYKKYLTDNINSLLYNYQRTYSIYLDYYLQLDKFNTSQLNKLNLQILKRVDLIYSDFGEGWSGMIFENLEIAYSLISEIILYLKEYAQRFKIPNLISRINSVHHSFYNDFKSHRAAQEKIFKDLEYRNQQKLKVIYLKKSLLS